MKRYTQPRITGIAKATASIQSSNMSKLHDTVSDGPSRSTTAAYDGDGDE